MTKKTCSSGLLRASGLGRTFFTLPKLCRARPMESAAGENEKQQMTEGTQ